MHSEDVHLKLGRTRVTCVGAPRRSFRCSFSVARRGDRIGHLSGTTRRCECPCCKKMGIPAAGVGHIDTVGR